MHLVTMNTKELTRLRVIQDLVSQRITPTIASRLLGITSRQIRTLRTRYACSGPSDLVSLRRGKPSNRAYPEQYRSTILDIIRTEYPDFGPTFAAEKLSERHGIKIGADTLRSWMITGGIWADRKARLKPVYQPRYRRDCFGELVQIDGSEHWWFEDRGPQCTLLVFIDDATSRLLELRFVESESAFSYFTATRSYLERYGKPIAFYSDKHGVFRVNAKGAVGGDGMTQFGRALHELNIDIICASTPQAKGRVERANRTLQDRLVKELRLAGVCTIEDANAMLPAFIADYNERFGKPPANEKNLHRPLGDDDKLEDVFVWRQERTVTANLTVQYDKVVFLLEQNDVARGLVRKKVVVSDYPDGRIVIAYNGLPLAYSIFDKVRQVDQGAIVDNKRLSSVLTLIRQEQQLNPQYRSEAAPRRRSQENSLFNEGGSFSAKRRQRASSSSRRRSLPKPLPGFVMQRVSQPLVEEMLATQPQSVLQPALSHDELLCLEIGRQVRQQREDAKKAAKASAEALGFPEEPKLLADHAAPMVLKEFRLFNRYVVTKRGRRPNPRKGQPRRTLPVVSDIAEAPEQDRISAGLVLAQDYAKAA